jgi:hypothetical protein
MLFPMPPSHAGDGAIGATWPRRDVDVETCWRQCCRVMLAMVLPGDMATVPCRCRVMLATMLLRHAGEGTAGATWPRGDIDAESC